MSTTDVSTGGNEMSVHLAPGIYRTAYSVVQMGSNVDTTRASTVALPSEGVAAILPGTRHRFHQLRDLRRELSGRPLPNTHSEAVSTAADATVMHTSCVSPLLTTASTSPQGASSPNSLPTAVSFGLPLDRLAADDPVTRYILRTAAAERALRVQQVENDDLKRGLIVQRRETAGMQALIDRLSSELSATGQTVLRQTATMKSLAAEMERLDAYHLIKEKRNSRAEAGASGTASASLAQPEWRNKQPLQLRQQVERLVRENAELKRQLSHFSSHHFGKRSGVPEIETIDREEDEVEGEMGCDRRLRLACTELQRLVRALATTGLGNRLPRLCANGDSDRAYELELSGVKCLMTLGAQNDLKDSSFVSNKVGCVVCVFGPHNMSDVLLCVDAGASALARHTYRRSRSPPQLPQSCTLYAMPDTCGLLRICLHEGMARLDAEASESYSADISAPVATTTVAVSTLLATALADRQGLEAVSATSIVHTVHLTTNSGAPVATVTFRVRVTEVHPRRYRAYGDMYGVTGSADRQRHSPFRPRMEAAPSCFKYQKGSASPPRSASAGSTDEKRTTKYPYSSSSRGRMLSPSRDDDATTPIDQQHLSFHFSGVSQSAFSAQTGIAMCRRSAVAPDCVPRPERGQVNLLPALSAATENCKQSLTNSAEIVHSVGNTKAPGALLEECDPQKKSDAIPVARDEITRKPLCGTSVPSPPRVLVPSPPATTTVPHIDSPASNFSTSLTPPVVVVPAPSRPPTPATAPSPSPASAIQIYIKEVRDLREGSADREVEDMLENSSLSVVVLIDEKSVFTAPRRWNPSHTVWSAAEGTLTTALSTGQKVCFEVRSDDIVRCQASLSASEILEARGEREVPLVSARCGSPCGSLTLIFEAPA